MSQVTRASPASTPLTRRPQAIILIDKDDRPQPLLFAHYQKERFFDYNVRYFKLTESETPASRFLATFAHKKMTHDSYVVVSNGLSNSREYCYPKLQPSDWSMQGQEITSYIRTAIRSNTWAGFYLKTPRSKDIHSHYCNWVKTMKEQGEPLQELASQQGLITVLHHLLPNVRAIRTSKPITQYFPSKEDIEMQWTVTEKAIADQNPPEPLEDKMRGVKRKAPPIEMSLPAPKKNDKAHIALTKRGACVARVIGYCTEKNRWPSHFYSRAVTTEAIHAHYCEITQQMQKEGYAIGEPAPRNFFMKVLHMLVPKIYPLSIDKQIECFPSKEAIQAQWEKTRADIAELHNNAKKLGKKASDTVSIFLSDPSNKGILSGIISVDNLFDSYVRWCRIKGYHRNRIKPRFETALCKFPSCTVSEGSVTFKEILIHPPL